MGIDLRRSRQGKFNRCKYYKKEYVDKMELKMDAVPQGVFYSEDVEPFQTSTLSAGSVLKKQTVGTIQTEDIVTDLDANWFVLYDGDLYIVDSVTIDDNTSEKHFSRMPSAITKIRLRR